MCIDSQWELLLSSSSDEFYGSWHYQCCITTICWIAIAWPCKPFTVSTQKLSHSEARTQFSCCLAFKKGVFKKRQFFSGMRTCILVTCIPTCSTGTKDGWRWSDLYRKCVPEFGGPDSKSQIILLGNKAIIISDNGYILGMYLNLNTFLRKV